VRFSLSLFEFDVMIFYNFIVYDDIILFSRKRSRKNG